MSKPQVIFKHGLSGDFSLELYFDNTRRLASLPLGSDEHDARNLAQQIMATFQACDGITDKTK